MYSITTYDPVTGQITGLAPIGNIVTNGNITANPGSFFVGDGGFLSNIAGGSKITNGTSNVDISTANGPITMVVNGVQIANIAEYSIALGQLAGATAQDIATIAIGGLAGNDTQGSVAIAIGGQAGQTTQGPSAVAIGGQAGQTTQGTQAVAIGINAGQDVQGGNSIAIGVSAAQTNQNSNSVAIGANAASNTQGFSSISIGSSAGANAQGANAVAIGANTASKAQSANTVAIGANAASNSQGFSSVAIGSSAGANAQGSNSVAIGATAASFAQAFDAIAIGHFAGNTFQSGNSIAIGTNSANSNQGANAIAIGRSAASNSQGSGSIAIGMNSGGNSQASNSIAIGANAGQTTQSANSIAIGRSAASTTQGTDAIAIGMNSGGNAQSANAIAIGTDAGSNSQAIHAIAIGLLSGANTQGVDAIAIGSSAGTTNQGVNSVAIGPAAGTSDQGVNSIAIGTYPALNNQGATSIAMGYLAAQDNQGLGAVAIGSQSGGNNQSANSVAIGSKARASGPGISLNATGSVLDAQFDGFYVAPVRNDTVNTVNSVYYNTTSKEFTYGPSSAGGVRNITKVSQGYNYGTMLIVADGKLFATKGNGNDNAWFAALGGQNTNTAQSLNNLYEIQFLDEPTALVIDTGTYGSSAYALFDNGNLYTWGQNGAGQLGLGDTNDRYYPQLSNTSVAQVYVTPSSNNNRWYGRLIMKKTDGTFWGCGWNESYELGLGVNTNVVSWVQLTWILPNPLSVWNLGNRYGSIVVQQSDGSITVTGSNTHGSLGIGSTTTPTTPQNAPLWLGGDSTMRIQSIHFGGPTQNVNGTIDSQIMIMFLDNGTTSRLVGSGSNDWGSLGNGNVTGVTVPTAPTSATGFSGRILQVMTSGCCGITVYAALTNGDLYAWGFDNQGQVGNGVTTDFGISSPAKIGTGVTNLYCDVQGWAYNGYLTPGPVVKNSAGTYYCCGYGAQGQLGNGYANTATNVLSTVFLKPGTTIKHFGSLGGSNEGITRFVVTDDDRIFVWGYNGTAVIEPSGGHYLVPVQFKPALLNK
jgi:alpha-tubulin suppressor-like RCC1 family protein